MLKLNPVKSDKPWGYELWIASTHKNGLQKDFLNFCKKEYPLLVKVIQADEALSIQVHPDDASAKKLEGPDSCGKTECWYILDAAPDAALVYGLKENYPLEELKLAIENNQLENYLNIVPVQKGDFVFIPSGTVHAIGKGLRLLEVQQSCDITYRLYDWGRPRELHVQKGLQVIKNQKLLTPAPFPGEFDCEYFKLNTVQIKGGWSMYCSKGDYPKACQLIYVISADKAVIRTSEQKAGSPIAAEDIFAVAPGEKITVEGKAVIMKITAK